ncbi:MAG TPA: MarR family transcriptional regulator [Thermomicrobiales bacterium]|nr:MarR family transcriptional regulator [Thermomicrobiales bacterium]
MDEELEKRKTGRAWRRRPDPLRLAAYRGFITAYAEVVTRIERDLAAAEVIPVVWYDVLIRLYESPGRRLRMHELAREVVMARSTLTRTVDRLEAAGLLRREPDPEDRRGAYAVLTEEGLEAMREAWPVYGRSIVESFALHISEDEARTLADVFQRIIAANRERG